MADVIKKLSITGATSDTRDIGAEAQNIEVSYDSAGNIISDITVEPVDHTKPLSEALKDTPVKNHASATDEYGAASATEYGHVKLGTGLATAADGSTEVRYGTTGETACAGNDSRLANKRTSPYAVTFLENPGEATGVDYDGGSARVITRDNLGAAKKEHSSETSEFGAASKDKYGHVKLGDGVALDSDNKLVLEAATKDMLGGVKVDGSSITIDADGTLHGGGSGGSNIEIYTSEPALFGKDVIVEAAAGADPVTVQFSSDGYAVVKGYMGTGSVNISSTGGGQTAGGSMNIPYFGNYAITLAFWSAPVTITTATPEMYGRVVTIKKDDLTVGTTSFSGSGVANFVAHTTGTYVFECTLGWKTFSSSLVISAEESYNVSIQGFVANVTVMTTTEEFKGALVTVSGEGIPSSTLTLGADDTAQYSAYEAGIYVFTIYYNGEAYSKNLVVSSQMDYTVAINLWTAVVNITTKDFANMTAQVRNTEDDSNVGAFTFDGDGKATYRIHKAGEYKFVITE